MFWIGFFIWVGSVGVWLWSHDRHIKSLELRISLLEAPSGPVVSYRYDPKRGKPREIRPN